MLSAGLAVWGLVHGVERLGGLGGEPPGQLVQNVKGPVVPAALVAGFGDDLVRCRPLPQTSAPDRHQRRLGHAALP